MDRIMYREKNAFIRRLDYVYFMILPNIHGL